VTSAILATIQEDLLSIETVGDCNIAWNPTIPFLQSPLDLTTRAWRRSALLLHCAKIRGEAATGNFIPSHPANAKFFAAG